MAVESFSEIYGRAATRHGASAIAERMPAVKSTRQLNATKDDRYLATMAKCVFRSGFVWRVVAAKWPGFEEAFRAFDPKAVAALTGDEVDALVQDTRIIRHRKKIESVVGNAELVLDTAREHGSFGRFLSAWPATDTVGLWDHLKREGQRLGGDTGPMFLRESGRDTFMLSRDVVGYLVAQGVIMKKPTSKRDLQAVQETFNLWAEESERPLSEISRVVAMSHGDVYEM